MASKKTKTLPSPITLLRDIQKGDLLAMTLSVEARRACVEHMHLEGYSVGEVAEILKVSSRTIRRDLAEIRASNAVERNPALVGQMVGHLFGQAEQTVSRLRRIGRDRECPHAARVEAERFSWTVIKELIETLQGLGYLPTSAKEVHADVTHRNVDALSHEELHAEIARVREAFVETENVEISKDLNEVGDQILRTLAGTKITEAKNLLEAHSSGGGAAANA